MALAGVLVLIYPKDGEPHVLFNKRSEHVDKHKGEIAFPAAAGSPATRPYWTPPCVRRGRRCPSTRRT